jgi:hypothetical protein
MVQAEIRENKSRRGGRWNPSLTSGDTQLPRGDSSICLRATIERLESGLVVDVNEMIRRVEIIVEYLPHGTLGSTNCEGRHN